MNRAILATRRLWRRLVPRWAFQIVARTGPREAPSTDVSDLTLPPPVGVVRVSTTHNRPGELIFLRTGFRSHSEALQSAQLLKSWLQVASALHLLSLDLGHDEAMSVLGPLPRP